MTGADLKVEFNRAIDAVAPGFLDDEISGFLTQAQLIMVKNLLGTNDATYLLAPLIHSTQLSMVPVSGSKYVDSIVYRTTLLPEILKVITDSVSTSVVDSITNNKLLFRCDVLSYENIAKYLKTQTNNPYLVRPVAFIGDNINSIYEDVLVVFTEELLSSLENYDTVSLYIDYIRYPRAIDVTDDVTDIELPKFADEIVNIAVKAALASLYMIQGIAGGGGAQQSIQNE